MDEGRGSPEPIRQMRDGQGVRHGCVVPEDSPEIRQEKKRRAVCPGRQYEHRSLFRSRGIITDDAKAELNPRGQRALGGLVGERIIKAGWELDLKAPALALPPPERIQVVRRRGEGVRGAPQVALTVTVKVDCVFLVSCGHELGVSFGCRKM